MSDLLRSIDERTRLAGTNKLEILLFTLGEDAGSGRNETFGINVFTVREVMRAPDTTYYARTRDALCGRRYGEPTWRAGPGHRPREICRPQHDNSQHGHGRDRVQRAYPGISCRGGGHVLRLDWSAMGHSLGVDAYVPKFDPIQLAETLRLMLRA